jgi:hypothetical protein
LKSMMLAAGAPAMTMLVGCTTRDDGAIPKLHCRTAPATTRVPTPAR